jgi:hypothetical protein
MTECAVHDRGKVTHRVQTVFGYSSTCDPTIITGKAPQDHGHFPFFYYNPDLSPFGICRRISYCRMSLPEVVVSGA